MVIGLHLAKYSCCGTLVGFFKVRNQSDLYFEKEKNHTNLLPPLLFSKQWPRCGPCQISNRSSRKWSIGVHCAVALFVYNYTSIWSTWLLLLCPGILWKKHSKLCPLCSFYGPQTMAPSAEVLRQLEPDTVTLWIKHHPSFDSTRLWKPKQIQQELPNCTAWVVIFIFSYLVKATSISE